MRDFALFGSYVSIEGLTFREVVWPLLFDTHIFCTLVCFSLVALPLPTVMAFSRSLCFVVGLCFAWFCCCCGSCVSGCLVVERACPCPPLCSWCASVSGPFGCPGFLFCLLVVSSLAVALPFCPPLPLAFGGAD